MSYGKQSQEHDGKAAYHSSYTAKNAAYLINGKQSQEYDGKAAYHSSYTAKNAAYLINLRGEPELEAYECRWCGKWHLGHKTAGDKFMRTALTAVVVIFMLVLLNGCEMSDHVNGQVNCTVNQSTGEVVCGGGVVIKNATREVRSVDPCGNSRVVARTIDARALNKSVRAQKADLEAQIHELNRVARATSTTAGMVVRRKLTPGSCCNCPVLPPAEDPLHFPAQPPVIEGGGTQTPVTLPESTTDGGSGLVFESHDAAKAPDLSKRVETLERRTDFIEAKVNTMDGKLDELLKRVPPKA